MLCSVHDGSYSPSGDVAAPLVYANYGRPEDFDALDAAGVSVEGTIVIARYGKKKGGLNYILSRFVFGSGQLDGGIRQTFLFCLRIHVSQRA